MDKIHRKTDPVFRIHRVFSGYRIRPIPGEATGKSLAPCTDRICPVDGTRLDRFSIHDTVIDCCPVCGGIWFDAGELKKLLKFFQDDRQTLPDRLSGTERRQSSDEKQRLCPVCQELMFKRDNGQASVTMDVCGKCSGVWTDGGEFELLLEQGTAHGMPPEKAFVRAVGNLFDCCV